MSPDFQAPEDYTEREVRAVRGNGCPFYNASFFHGILVHPGSLGNRCALITTARSPCWMEVGEASPPNWIDCPRNPEFVALNIFENLRSDVVAGREADGRLLDSVRFLKRLMRGRAVVGDPQ